MAATNKPSAGEATPRDRDRALKLLEDPASPRIVLEPQDLCDALARPRRRSGFWVILAVLARPSPSGALVWVGLGALTFGFMLGTWPDLRVDWPAILISLLTVLTPLVSITIPLAVHTVRQRGRLVAEYFLEACRLKVFCVVAVASLLLGIVSLVCFRCSLDAVSSLRAIAAGPSVVLGLTMASVLGLAYILLNTLECTGLKGRVHASRYLAARLAGKAVQGASLEEELTIVYADMGILMADADLASFRALVQSLAQVPRCYTRFVSGVDRLQLQLLWNVHVQVMAHVVGRGAYNPSASKPGPIAARFADEYGQVLAKEFHAYVKGADAQNVAAASETILGYFCLLQSARNDKNLPREVSDEFFRLRGRAAFHYFWLPDLEHVFAQTEPAKAAQLVESLHRGMMGLLIEAAERKDNDVVEAVSKGVAELYAAAQKRLTDVGASGAAQRFTYDYWILLGHFVARAIDGVEGAWGAAMALHEPFGQSGPRDLMETFLGLPEPTWDHPLYSRERASWSAWNMPNPVSGFSVGPTRSIGQPGRELNAALAFLLARSWRMGQPAPAVVPCPHDLGEAKKRLDAIFAKADGWHLNMLDQDKAAIHQWLDDCAAAHSEIERQKYMATPLSQDKTRKFEMSLRVGFWESAVLLHHIPTLLTKPADGSEMLRCWTTHGPRSLYFGDRPDQDIARFGHDSGVYVATVLHQEVVSQWCRAVAVALAGPVDPVNGMVAASDWLGQTQAEWDGMIVVVGPYELRARIEALPDYRPHAAQAEYSREFLGTYRGHPLLWLRTSQDDATRRVYAFRLSDLRKQGAGNGAAPCGVDRNVWPKVTFKEAGDLAKEYRSQDRTQDADEIAKRPGDVYVMAELGHLSDAMPEGRMWDVAQGNAPPAGIAAP